MYPEWILLSSIAIAQNCSPKVILAETTGFFSSECPMVLSSDLSWTGKGNFTLAIKNTASHLKTSANELLQHHVGTKLAKITDLKQGFTITPPKYFSDNIDCFRYEVCIINAYWQRGSRWEISEFSEPTLINLHHSKLYSHVAIHHYSVHYQLVIFGRKRISLWSKELTWNVSYSLQSWRLLSKYPESKTQAHSYAIPSYEHPGFAYSILGYQTIPV
ncbi:hypothetical protein DSO57_1022499 [Entomophthora muscae]|uniref:Uncharacterized protein n=1 Tax=Entomophthora muscae TaxID=34485 RepID=A0ACC2UPA4_9FUNG|nr:hypothetical protein DSO57_1022499 [Entomophthora muscae]